MSSSIEAFIAFLKCEANQAEQRAKSLRTTAAAIEANIPYEDRSRKRLNPHTSKNRSRSQQGYSLYVRENYDAIKQQLHLNGEEDSNKAIIAIIKQQWAENMNEEEKEAWNIKAEQLKTVALEVDGADSISETEILEANPLVETQDFEPGRKKRARKSPPQNSGRDEAAHLEFG